MISKTQATQVTSGQTYASKDTDLIKSISLNKTFGKTDDYVEMHVYDLNDTLLYSNLNYKNYSYLLDSNVVKTDETNILYVEPSKDAINAGFSKGSVKVLYNFLKKKIINDNAAFYIKEISADRTEIRLASNVLSNNDITTQINSFIEEINSVSYYKDFLLNFGDNTLLIGINIALDSTLPQYSVLVKLYEPLPFNFSLKDTLWIVEQISNPTTYLVDFIVEETVPQTPNLRGPNFDIELSNQLNVSTEYKDINQILNTSYTSSFQQLLSIMDEKGIEINIDYSDYSNFVHYSSAKERLLNFVYKLKLLEFYQEKSNELNNITPISQSIFTSGSNVIYQNKINEIIQKFDGYEYYLYYTSASAAWPKSTSNAPYTLYPVSSSEATTWLGSNIDSINNTEYGGQLLSASLFDKYNPDYIINTLPEYIRIDEQNEGYALFLSMIGQNFDNNWIYIKSVTDLYNAQNSLTKGISQDLVCY